MTTFEPLSLVAQFSVSIIAVLTLIVAIVVFLERKSNRPRINGWRLLFSMKPNNLVSRSICSL